MSGKHILEVKERDDGEMVIQLTPEILEAAGLQIGDAIDWQDNGDGSYSIKKKETQWVLVETVSIFRDRYMVQVPSGHDSWALDAVVCGDAKVFSDKHLDETIVSHRVVTREEALEICDQDNDYFKTWDDGKKIEVFFTTLEDMENGRQH